MENGAYFLKCAFTGVKLMYVHLDLLEHSPVPTHLFNVIPSLIKIVDLFDKWRFSYLHV